MASERTLTLRRLQRAVADAQAPRKEKAQFGRRNGPTCALNTCEGCGHVFIEQDIPDAQCPMCGAEVNAS